MSDENAGDENFDEDLSDLEQPDEDEAGLE